MVISMHFRFFLKFKVKNGYVFGVLLIFQIFFWGTL